MTTFRDTEFLVRAQKLDAVTNSLISTLQSAGVSPVIVADERNGALQTGQLRKISICEKALTDLGLERLPDNWAWFCGDLCYYLAESQLNAKRYCLIESDVFIPPAVGSRFVEAMVGHPASAIAANLKPNFQKKRYAAGLTKWGVAPSFGCIFPVTQVSQAVLRDMKHLRKEALERGISLNDEAILTGAIQRGGHDFAALEDAFPELFDPAFFQTNPPHLFEAVSVDSQLDSLVHPVVNFETIIRRIETGEKTYSRHRLRKVLKTCPKPMKKMLKLALLEADAKEAKGEQS